MPQSNIVELLTSMQAELNKLTIACIRANNSITGLLGLYDGQWHTEAEVNSIAKSWTTSLVDLADSFDEFQASTIKLWGYLDAQG